MDKIFNKFIYERHSNIIFSLSGSRVKEIKFHNKTLNLKVDSLYQYINNEEVEHEGEVRHRIEFDISIRHNKIMGYNIDV